MIENVQQPRHLPSATARFSNNIPLIGQIDGTPWRQAEPLYIDQYSWHERGKKQGTTLRLLYDDAALYTQFQCEDAHIFSETTALNGPVYRDSCVEFFATIDPAKGPDYFNLEMNACGMMLMGWGPAGGGGRSHISEELARTITIVSSVSGPTKQESPADNGWWLVARVPFATLTAFTGRPVRPARGTIWRCNAFRCGGKTEDQFASWAWIDMPHPTFHQPQFFGELLFE